MLQHRQSHRHLSCIVILHVVIFAYISNNVEYLDKEQRYRNSTKEVGCDFKCSLQCNQEKTGQNSVA